MKVGVILNRVFRLENNPLFEYISQNKEDIDQCYFIIPQEKFDKEAEMKANYYYGTLQKFVDTLHDYDIQPFLVDYDELTHFCKDKGISEVVLAGDIMSYHEEKYDILQQSASFKNEGISVVSVRANHYFKPSKTRNNKGEPYKVFTSFYKKWRPYLMKRSVFSYDIKDIAKMGVKSQQKVKGDYSQYGISEADAQYRWSDFLDKDIENYNTNREYLPEVLTSQLSIYLAYGVLDIIQIFNDLLENYDKDEQNYESFIRELIFREFYYVLMTYYPETAHQSFKDKYRDLQWSYNKENFNLWKEGKTGFPIIDAAMGELNTTGYMHNRMRMVVSQFLTKDLFIDWTWGEEYFRQKLIDYDSASNVHGWQWSASTGTDAVPYFRMFNPVRQSERFDKDALYIKKFVQTLNDIDAKYLHDTHKYERQIKEQGIELGKDYPKQIVNHSESRTHVMSEFKALE
ncbi:cryptochrome/photolyase family protein [Staphylococcus caprae]|nr:deoxyribodipyrimidine photo-lyase [Staphylococcus caprae]EES41008.1 FAD binding domain of DNA photolyase [Staphylococcus caprae M23864:W1]MBX5322137.1 deoxyribodipyrimidine photo-lyase [Staphylococcus caprae]MDI0014999.1 deoxyribodipyrimidine photo-lyase [Staphylococcus caprae]MEB8093727.1 DNA photolyase family protein [Staphylococcus caprae]QDW94689.1 deoxyribodipyrimidine photo-lyase [Staphylococcus caprae]